MFGDGLRCDMAMLLLPEVFASTWRLFPAAGARQTSASFWNHVIPRIRQLQPNADLIAEVYWDREQELQDAGFDYTYNKRVTDFLMRGEDGSLVKLLHESDPQHLLRSVHFLENHDEARAASVMPSRRHKAAAALVLFLPGMALLHDGQLEGRERFARIQMSKRPPEPPDADLREFYEELLLFVQQTRIRRGKSRLLRFEAVESLVAIVWTGRDGITDVGVVTLGREPVRLALGALGGDCECIYSSVPGIEIKPGQQAHLPSESAHILRFKRSATNPAGAF
jgi:hypothetical protein